MNSQQLEVVSGLLQLWPLWLACGFVVAIAWKIESGNHDSHFHQL